MSGTISFSQKLITNPDDFYTLINYNVRDITPDEYLLTVTGDVEADSEYSLADLQAMDQVTHRATKTCVINPVGGTEIYNTEHTGVDLISFLEAAGMKEGANAIYAEAYDGWNWTQSIEALSASQAFLGLTMNGEDLAAHHGYPVTLGIPGEPGAEWVKYLQKIEVLTLAEEDLPKPLYEEFSVPFTCYHVNAGFLQPTHDGMETTSPVHIEGWAFSWPRLAVDKIMFSADYGKTWNEYEVPASMDPNQWVYWNIEWTPPGPGHYLLKVKAQSGDVVQQREDNVVIVVTE